MKGIAALIAPVLLTSFSAVAGTPDATVSIETVTPDKRIVVLHARQICGGSVSIRENLRDVGHTVIGTYIIQGRACRTGDIPQNTDIRISVDLADTAKVLGMPTRMPDFRAITKLDMK